MATTRDAQRLASMLVFFFRPAAVENFSMINNYGDFDPQTS